MPSPQELQAIRNNVAQMVDAGEDIDRLSWLMSRLSTNNRALFLFDPELLRYKLDDALRIVHLQDDGAPPVRVDLEPEDEYFEVPSPSLASTAPSVDGTEARSEASSRRLEILRRIYGENPDTIAAGSEAKVEPAPAPVNRVVAAAPIPPPQVPDFEDPHVSPYDRSVAMYNHSLRGLEPLPVWNCRLSSPPDFPVNFNLHHERTNEPKAIVVWRGADPGVYGFYEHSRRATERIRFNRFHAYEDVAHALEMWRRGLAHGGVVLKLINASARPALD